MRSYSRPTLEKKKDDCRFFFSKLCVRVVQFIKNILWGNLLFYIRYKGTQQFYSRNYLVYNTVYISIYSHGTPRSLKVTPLGCSCIMWLLSCLTSCCV